MVTFQSWNTELIRVYLLTGNMNGLDCGHFFCAGCYIGYLTFKIMQEGASQMIECPETKCHTIVDEPTLMSIVTDPKIKLKYQKLIIDHYVQCNKLVRWCSAPDCSYAIKVKNKILIRAEKKIFYICHLVKAIAFKLLSHLIESIIYFLEMM